MAVHTVSPTLPAGQAQSTQSAPHSLRARPSSHGQPHTPCGPGPARHSQPHTPCGPGPVHTVSPTLPAGQAQFTQSAPHSLRARPSETQSAPHSLRARPSETQSAPHSLRARPSSHGQLHTPCGPGPVHTVSPTLPAGQAQRDTTHTKWSSHSTHLDKPIPDHTEQPITSA